MPTNPKRLSLYDVVITTDITANTMAGLQWRKLENDMFGGGGGGNRSMRLVVLDKGKGTVYTMSQTSWRTSKLEDYDGQVI
jgi:hypothetical protein